MTAQTPPTGRSLRRRLVLTASAGLLGLVTVIPLVTASPASAATRQPARPAAHHSAAAHQAGSSTAAKLSGTTRVTTAPGIAAALIKGGVLPLPVLPATRFSLGYRGGVTASYGFPITGGDPDLSGPSGDILHSGGIYFASRTAHLEIGKFDIDLADGKVYATEVNFAAARIPVLDLDLAHLQVSTSGGRTVLSGIALKLDPVAAGALNATFGLALPTDGSLVFAHATVTLR